jgi:hypothetical protein
VLLAVALLASSVRIVRQFERGVVFRFGRVVDGTTRGPGIALLVPIADRMQKVNMQIVTMPVPAQDGITRDNVTVRVDAVIYFRVVDPVRVAVDVQDYLSAVGQLAQTSLRSIIGKSDLDDLLSNREKLNQGMELMIDSPVGDWGLHIDRVEIKDVALPETMKRSMSRQAEPKANARSRPAGRTRAGVCSGPSVSTRTLRRARCPERGTDAHTHRRPPPVTTGTTTNGAGMSTRSGVRVAGSTRGAHPTTGSGCWSTVCGPRTGQGCG